MTKFRKGDIVRARNDKWGEGAYIEGPLHEFKSDRAGLWIGGFPIVDSDGRPEPFNVKGWTVELIKAAPRFYSNSDRDHPVVGDVAHTLDSVTATGWANVGPWFYTAKGWISSNGTPIKGEFPETDNVLLVDGRTRRVVLQWQDVGEIADVDGVTF